MIEKKRILLAAGAHGRVVLDALLLSGLTVDGILDPGLWTGENAEPFIFGVPVLGDDTWLNAQNNGEVELINGLGALPRNRRRTALFESLKERGYSFTSVRHPSAVIGRGTSLEEGSQIMAGAVVQCQVSIGVNVIINTRASVDHDVLIGAHAFIGPGAILCGTVRVGKEAFVGAGAVLLPGVTIGANAVVGAGTVVTQDVAEGLCVMGIPGRKCKKGST